MDYAIRFVCALCVVGLIASRAQATTFVRMDEGDLAARAVAAVVATVADVGSGRVERGAIVTTVVLEPEEVVFGALPPGPITLVERGGTVGDRTERIFGSADYQPGERVLAFLSRGVDGTLHTTAMAMGKYRVEREHGDVMLRRSFDDDVTVLDPATGAARESGAVEVMRLSAMVQRLRAAPTPSTRRTMQRPGGAQRLPTPQRFTYLGEPSRWFEPDEGVPVHFAIDPRGDTALGPDASVAAAVDALAAWSQVDGSTLLLTDGMLHQVQPFAGCEGDTRVVFNDPFDEIDAPSNCRGVLGIGGFCRNGDTRTVNGTDFKRITLGKVVLADGWGGCPTWNPCNLSEVLTHEIGHALGLGHSDDATATMRGSANFDGRCANLAADDVEGLRSLYPPAARSTPTRTPTYTSMASPTRTPTRQRTATARPMTPTPRIPGYNAITGRIRYFDSGLPVAGATVELRGDSGTQRASTAGGGQYAFSAADGSWTIEPRKTGDVGGAISALDAAWILQAIAGMRPLSEAQRLACDVSGNGSLSSLDATRILQLRAGDLPRLPAADLCGSDWLFLPDAAPVAGQSMAMPGYDLGICQRGAVMLTPLQGDVREQDLRAAVIGDCTGNWQPGSAGDVAGPSDAADDTELVMPPPQRRPGGRWLQAIGVRAADGVHSLELELRYDVSRLELAGVRSVRLGQTAILHSHSEKPGRLTIAMASAHPFPADGRAVILVEFTSREREISSRLVRPYTAAVDERVLIAK